MNTLLKLNEVKLQIEKKIILNIPDLQIVQGEFLGVMGPNGAGKSTLLKLLAFLECHSSGVLSYLGKELSASTISLETRRKFSIALQQSLLLDGTVFQNIALGLKLRKVPKKEIKKKVDYWMETFQISHLAKKNALTLSGGEAQRVNLARAMAVDPDILFLDEPFSALDFPTKIKLMEDFKHIAAKSNTTTVFVSHDLAEIRYLTTTLAIMLDGQIKQSGLTFDVLEHPNRDTASFLNEWKKFY
ncbi:MAG: ATP-binding cassette domain-containing protein [Bacillota bacterium]|nr:ATP-binding cassette domain-containing protein [Bacillota bacterium]